MPSGYPAALDTTALFPTTIQDDWDATSGADAGTTTQAGFLASLLNNTDDAIVKIETELGINPSASFVDVATRLNQMTTVRKTADQAFTTTTLANATDMVFPVVVGASYTAMFLIMWTTATAGVVQQHGVTYPAATRAILASESFVMTALATEGTDMVSTSLQTASGTKVGGLGTTTIPGNTSVVFTRLTLMLNNVTAAGNIQLQAASETASTTTMSAGSHGILWTN